MNDEELTTQLARRLELAAPTSSSWSLVVVDGEGHGAVVRLDDVVTRRVWIGSSPACDVRLAGRAVSRRHAALESDGVGLRVVDAGSRNGTWIGSTRVRDAYLVSGDLVRFGDITVRLESDGIARVLDASTEACFGRIVGASPEMRALYPVFDRVAKSDVPVLLEGEAGTGKEALAESLHEVSSRSGGPFVFIDASTLTPLLAESELFGHERGAFADAGEARAGAFESANGGTLFIDEVGDLDLPLQAKLLRAIERSEIRRLGGAQWLRVDVRVIAATRRDLDREIAARRFREDLYSRLAVARLELPPLRKRQGDVAFLTQFFWEKLGGRPNALPPSLLVRLERQEWPGNVRELASAIAKYLAFGDADALATRPPEPPRSTTLTPNDFIGETIASGEPLPIVRQRVRAELERRYVDHMLDLHGGNVTRAAAASGIGRRYFHVLRARRDWYR